jgi:O-acetyl-ADP-ribose deacetylase (regulator of RNase III)
MSVHAHHNNLDLEDYRQLISLDEPFTPPAQLPETQPERQEIIARLVTHLQRELRNPQAGDLPSGYTEKRRLLKAMLTVREPDPLPDWFTPLFDQLLQYERRQRPDTTVQALTSVAKTFPGTGYPAAEQAILWQGDITTLAAGAIVNAANSQLLGCFQPFHACIDNVIHSAAGPQVREDCARIINAQGNLEGTGWAKITRGYNLPAKFILHTVGPIVAGGRVSPLQEEQLANCYTACLDLAARVAGIRSVAFCSISTGVFGYPKQPAAGLALETVAHWLQSHPGALERVVFNVYLDEDREIYQKLFAV